MKMSGNTILITGGGTGIGFSLARQLVEAGNTVLICGRREEKLLEAQKNCPALKIKVADVANPEGQQELARWGIENGVNILINNAGIQREVDFKRGIIALTEGDSEVRTNFEALIYLTALFVPYLMKQKNAAIYNVSSGLAFVPLAIMPIYCATKAALHSFTITLRYQLKSTGIKVVEIIPPIVDTELDRGARAKRGQTNRGISADESAEIIMKGMAEGLPEIAIGMATNFISAEKNDFDGMFNRMNGPR